VTERVPIARRSSPTLTVSLLAQRRWGKARPRHQSSVIAIAFKHHQQHTGRELASVGSRYGCRWPLPTNMMLDNPFLRQDHTGPREFGTRPPESVGGKNRSKKRIRCKRRRFALSICNVASCFTAGRFVHTAAHKASYCICAGELSTVLRGDGKRQHGQQDQAVFLIFNPSNFMRSPFALARVFQECVRSLWPEGIL